VVQCEGKERRVELVEGKRRGEWNEGEGEVEMKE